MVITGASGFLGHALSGRLVEGGFDVIPVSRRPLPGMQTVRHYGETPAGDVLIHCAETADRGAVNSLGDGYTRQSADVAAALAERFGSKTVYVSSGVVYGDEHELPCTTGMRVEGTDVYTRSKLVNEEIVLSAGGSVIRLSNLVGPGMSTATVLSDIIRQIPGTGPLRVRDDTPVRDFLSVSDAVSAFHLLIQRGHRGILNVGSGVGTSVRALAEMAMAAAGEFGRGVLATSPSARRSINVLDVSQTESLLGWVPVSPLKTELHRLLNTGRLAE